ncbi:hypothetical protein IFO70_29550 [Phormidium tenue FACHB-886]|jgi:hypothetical protein|nr:hypothetical protein [Phormidium tenue FACHB-886]
MQDNFITVNQETLNLIGFRLDPERETPQVYTLFICNDENQPIVVDEQIVFFSNPELASKALELYGANVGQYNSIPKDVDLVCDLATMLYLITSEDTDPSAIIVNCLNTFDDLVKATELQVPNEYKKVLNAFADHLTFDQEFANFLTQQNISRSVIIDGVLWCVGAILVKARILMD